VHVPLGNNGEDCAQSVELDDGGESLLLIDSYSLIEALDN
jgi:hypothetical protein